MSATIVITTRRARLASFVATKGHAHDASAPTPMAAASDAENSISAR